MFHLLIPHYEYLLGFGYYKIHVLITVHQLYIYIYYFQTWRVFSNYNVYVFCVEYRMFKNCVFIFRSSLKDTSSNYYGKCRETGEGIWSTQSVPAKPINRRYNQVSWGNTELWICQIILSSFDNIDGCFSGSLSISQLSNRIIIHQSPVK